MSVYSINSSIITNKLTQLEMLSFDYDRISILENELLSIIENTYGKTSFVYKIFYFHTAQGFWKPSKGDPSGSATCRYIYQKEYQTKFQIIRGSLNQLNKQFEFFFLIDDKSQFR